MTMHYDYANELSSFELAQRYFNMGPNTVHFVDNIIQHGNSKIATIRFLRAQLKISLSLAKLLYEERQKFLTETPNPFGWVK